MITNENLKYILNITRATQKFTLYVADGCWIKHLFHGSDHARKQQH